MFNEAELPLNNRQAVYHLDLTANEIADTIITVGDPARVEQVSRYFDNIEIKRSHREFVTHTGTYKGKPLTVLSTGIGMPNIDIVINELDVLASVDLSTRRLIPQHRQLSLIRLGTTGCVSDKVAIGDVISSAFALGMDNMMDFYTHPSSASEIELKKICQQHCPDYTSQFFVSEANSTLQSIFSTMAKPGITITCNGFYAAQGRALRHDLRFPHLYRDLAGVHWNGLGVTNIEMETAALYGLGKLMGHRCVSLSVVLANRVTGVFADNIENLVTSMIQNALIEINQKL